MVKKKRIGFMGVGAGVLFLTALPLNSPAQAQWRDIQYPYSGGSSSSSIGLLAEEGSFGLAHFGASVKTGPLSYYGGRGYRGYRKKRRRHGKVDAGDVFLGVAILGGLIAIADSAADKKERKEQRRREEAQRREHGRDYERDGNYGTGGGLPRGSASRFPSGGVQSDITLAVQQCGDAARQAAADGTDPDNVALEQIISVTRANISWVVDGVVSAQYRRSFRCQTTEGLVDFVQFGERANQTAGGQ